MNTRRNITAKQPDTTKLAITKKRDTTPISLTGIQYTLPIIPKKPESITPISTALCTRANPADEIVETPESAG